MRQPPATSPTSSPRREGRGSFRAFRFTATAEVQREGKFRTGRDDLWMDRARAVSKAKEPREASALRFIGIDRKRVVAPAPRVHDVVLATAEGLVITMLDQVEAEG